MERPSASATSNMEILGLTGAAAAGLVALTGLGRNVVVDLAASIPLVLAVAVVAAGISAHLLMTLGAARQRPMLRWVAVGQLSAAIVMAVHVAGLPSIAPGGGILGTSAAGGAWLQPLWHLAVPLAVLAGAAAVDRRLQWPTVAAISLVAIAVAWNDRIHVPTAFMTDLGYTGVLRATLAATTIVAFLAVAVWFRGMGQRPGPVEICVGASLALHGFEAALHALAPGQMSSLWWAALGARLAHQLVLTGGLLSYACQALRHTDAYGECERQSASSQPEALTDPLTGTLNRAGILIGTDELLRDQALPAIVIVVDLDGFKDLNDERGHEAGDRLLRLVGSTLRTLTRGGDLVGRWDGDEFVVVFPVADTSVAGMLVDRIANGIARVAPATVCHSVLQPREPGGLRAALARADVALYIAKNGRRQADGTEPLRAATT